jgi:hypothetical protein
VRTELRPFESVFNGESNFVPRAILDLRRGAVPIVANLLKTQAVGGEDGLDEFEAVPMVLVDHKRREHRFALWRHKATPPGQVAIRMPLEDEFERTLAAILTVMEVPAAALIWSDVPAPQPARLRRAAR